MASAPSEAIAPQAILTEILGILVEDPWARAAAELSRRTGSDVRTMRAALAARLPSFERGGEDLEAFYREVALVGDLAIGLDAFAEVLLESAIAVDSANVELLQGLRERQGVRLVAVSNVPAPVYEAIDRRHPISMLFDASVLSFREGLAKPNPQVYIEAIERSGVPPGSILFVDTTEERVRAAAEWGLPNVLVPAPNALAPALERRFALER
ncbi:MAG TPA: HAD family hydrolase [Thermoplasmata archaeon]|nr:HAD family hydrolase [Thermoplasmata archaeon]